MNTGIEPPGIRVFVVAEVKLYEEGLAAVLASEARFAVVGTAASLSAGLDRIAALVPAPDVVLVDLAGARGPSAVGVLHDQSPESRVVALGVRDSEADVISWAEAGVDGFVSRQASLVDMMATVESVARGETLCSPRTTATLLRHVRTLARARQPARPAVVLTARERQIADLIDQGLSNKEIAQRLCIELPTVKNHVHNLLEKFGVRRRAEAAAAFRAAPPGSLV